MKLTIGRRIVLFIEWLLSLAIVAAFFAARLSPIANEWIESMLARIPEQRIIFIGAAAAYMVFSIATLLIVFSRGKKHSDRGYIVMDSSDSGRTRIAVSAIEQMVKQAVDTVDGINEMKIGITSADEAIVINVNATINSGAHVPTVTMNTQRAIRQFVEMNCGVAVRSVPVNILSVASGTESNAKRGKKDVSVPPKKIGLWGNAKEEPAVAPADADLQADTLGNVSAPAYEAPTLTLDNCVSSDMDTGDSEQPESFEEDM